MSHSTHFGPLLLTATIFLFASIARGDDPMPQPLTVLSFNIRYDNRADGPNRWQHRREAVAALIGPVQVAGLQEVLHSQLTDLKEALPDFTAVGVGRDDGKQQGEYSPILYRTARFELRDSGTFWLSAEPEKVGSKGWDASLPRICTWAKLFDKENAREFYFFNTHFDHRGEQARLESAKLIVKQVAALRGASPVILTGDFNATPESEPIQAILTTANAAGTRLADSRTLSKANPVGPETTWNGFEKVMPNRRIDFAFIGGPLEVLTYEEVVDQLPDDRFPSDHFPVRIKIAFE